MGKVVGGWKIAGLQQYQSGGRASPYFGEFGENRNQLWPYEGANAFVARPNMVPGVNPKSAAVLSGHFDPAKGNVLNPAAFSTPEKFTFGNAPRTLGNARSFSLSQRRYLHHKTHERKRASQCRVSNGLPEYLQPHGFRLGYRRGPVWFRLEPTDR